MLVGIIKSVLWIPLLLGTGTDCAYHSPSSSSASLSTSSSSSASTSNKANSLIGQSLQSKQNGLGSATSVSPTPTSAPTTTYRMTKLDSPSSLYQLEDITKEIHLGEQGNESAYITDGSDDSGLEELDDDQMEDTANDQNNQQIDIQRYPSALSSSSSSHQSNNINDNNNKTSADLQQFYHALQSEAQSSGEQLDDDLDSESSEGPENRQDLFGAAGLMQLADKFNQYQMNSMSDKLKAAKNKKAKSSKKLQIVYIKVPLLNLLEKSGKVSANDVGISADGSNADADYDSLTADEVGQTEDSPQTTSDTSSSENNMLLAQMAQLAAAQQQTQQHQQQSQQQPTEAATQQLFQTLMNSMSQNAILNNSIPNSSGNGFANANQFSQFYSTWLPMAQQQSQQQQVQVPQPPYQQPQQPQQLVQKQPSQQPQETPNKFNNQPQTSQYQQIQNNSTLNQQIKSQPSSSSLPQFHSNRNYSTYNSDTNLLISSKPRNQMYQPDFHGSFKNFIKDDAPDQQPKASTNQLLSSTKQQQQDTKKPKKSQTLGILPIVIQIDSKAIRNAQAAQNPDLLLPNIRIQNLRYSGNQLFGGSFFPPENSVQFDNNYPTKQQQHIPAASSWSPNAFASTPENFNFNNQNQTYPNKMLQQHRPQHFESPNQWSAMSPIGGGFSQHQHSHEHYHHDSHQHQDIIKNPVGSVSVDKTFNPFSSQNYDHRHQIEQQDRPAKVEFVAQTFDSIPRPPSKSWNSRYSNTRQPKSNQMEYMQQLASNLAAFQNIPILEATNQAFNIPQPFSPQTSKFQKPQTSEPIVFDDVFFRNPLAFDPQQFQRAKLNRPQKSSSSSSLRNAFGRLGYRNSANRHKNRLSSLIPSSNFKSNLNQNAQQQQQQLLYGSDLFTAASESNPVMHFLSAVPPPPVIPPVEATFLQRPIPSLRSSLIPLGAKQPKSSSSSATSTSTTSTKKASSFSTPSGSSGGVASKLRNSKLIRFWSPFISSRSDKAPASQPSWTKS